MVATAHLLSASPHDAKAIGEIAGYYAGREVLGYYDSGTESKGYWFGGAIEHLGLEGEVKHADLFHLLRGRDPHTKQQLVRLQTKTDDKQRKAGQDRAGLDITFSAPKSVSALWAFSSKEHRAIIESCCRSAVEDTLMLIQSNCLSVRTGKGGCNWDTGQLAFALFQHFTARNENDPNLHIHALAPNVVVTKEGKTQKINTKSLLSFIRTAGPLYRNSLLTKLTEQLGVRAVMPMRGEKQAGWFELEGFPGTLLKKFSSRSQEIDDQVAAFGYSNAHASAKQNANFATRKAKGAPLPLHELESVWQEKARTLGITKAVVQQVIGHAPIPIKQSEIETAIKKAISQLTENEAVFDRWSLVRKTSELLQDKPITGAKVIEQVDQHLQQSRELVLTNSQSGQAIYSTQQMAKMEQETIECVERMAAAPGLKVAQKYIEKAIKRSSVKLSDEQENCVREVLSANASIASIVGHAGAGKTTILRVMVDAYELAGKKVIGTSIGGVAVDKIRESINRESRTVASFLREFESSKLQEAWKSTKHQVRMFARAARKKSTWSQTKRQTIDKNTVVLADESGMIDLLMMHPLLTEVERRKASIVFIGDGAQLQPVGPGNPLLHINAKVDVQELKTNWRQTAEEAKAALQVREGDAQQALKTYADKGDLVITKERNDAIKKLISDWAEQSIKDPANSVVIAQTNKEVDLLNRLCQEERSKAGLIYGRGIEVNGRKFHRGDRVIFRGTDGLIGVKNGYRGSVISIGDDGSLTIKIDGKPSEVTWKERLRNGLLTVPNDKSLIKITDKQAAKVDLRLGYSSTTHSYQGSQADYVFVLLGGKHQDRNLSYVQLSRSVQQSRLYVDRAHAGPELKSIIAVMNKQNTKENVHAVTPRLELKLERKLES